MVLGRCSGTFFMVLGSQKYWILPPGIKLTVLGAEGACSCATGIKSRSLHMQGMCSLTETSPSFKQDTLGLEIATIL